MIKPANEETKDLLEKMSFSNEEHMKVIEEANEHAFALSEGRPMTEDEKLTMRHIYRSISNEMNDFNWSVLVAAARAPGATGPKLADTIHVFHSTIHATIVMGITESQSEDAIIFGARISAHIVHAQITDQVIDKAFEDLKRA